MSIFAKMENNPYNYIKNDDTFTETEWNMIRVQGNVMYLYLLNAMCILTFSSYFKSVIIVLHFILLNTKIMLIIFLYFWKWQLTGGFSNTLAFWVGNTLKKAEWLGVK